MNDIEKRKLADQADMIVNGYAYTHTAQDFSRLQSEFRTLCRVFSHVRNAGNEYGQY